MYSAGVDLDPRGARPLVKERALDSRMTQGGLLNAKATGFVHVPQIRHDAVSGTTLGVHRLHQRPVVVTLAVVLNRDLAKKHAANIQHCTGRSQEAKFSLHGSLEEKRTLLAAIANFERQMIKHIFQLSNLG